MTSIQALRSLPKTPYVVCGYGRVVRNYRDTAQPLVEVILRRPRALGSFRCVPVSLTNLGQLRCGDVVEAGRVTKTIPLEQEHFAVDFSPSSWRLEWAGALCASFPKGHWLHDFTFRGWMVVFEVERSYTLRVPCLELFSRCYGRSQEVKRVLATYPWSEARSRLLPAPGRPATAAAPVVKILPPFVKDDAAFLATLRHCARTERVARAVYSQLDSACSSRVDSGSPHCQRPGAFLKVPPWFDGPAELLVEGEPVEGGFLVHRILGCSDPPGPAVVVVRERDERFAATAESSSFSPGRALSRRHPAPSPVELTADEPPGRDAGHVEVHDTRFVVLGTARPVAVEHVPRSGAARRLPRQTPRPSRYSTGDATGRDPDVGQARIHAEAERECGPSECDDFLLGMWHALLALCRRFSWVIQSPRWYTTAAGFQSGGTPRTVVFPHPRPADRRLAPLKTSVRSWVWLDPRAHPPSRRRGVLVLCCEARDRDSRQWKQVCLLEVQRRAGEKLTGLVFPFTSSNDFGAVLELVRATLPHKQGVFSKIIDQCPDGASVFKHSNARGSKAPYEAAVRNALSKVEVALP